MDLTNAVVWQGLAATGLAVALVVGVAWWLYLSPVRARGGTLATSPRLVGWLTAALGVSAVQFLVGGLWDASQHIRTGIVVGGADFLWPSHIVLYGSFLLAFVSAGVAMGFVAVPAWRAGIRDPRLWVRRQPYLGAVALASAYELMAIPGDALWHQIFGVDLTAWSPPHVMLAGMMGLVLVSTLGALRHARFAATWKPRVDLASILLLGVALNAFCMVGTLEWELPTHAGGVMQRPLWFYPAVFGGLSFFTLVLARVLVASRWAATQAALAFYAVRLVLTVGLSVTGNVAPALPLVPLLGAALLDLAWDGRALTLRSAAVGAAAFTLGYAALALPQLALWSDLPAYGAANDAAAVVATFAAALVLFPMTVDVGRALRGDTARSTARPARGAVPAS